jgi:hypothetical protein
MFLGRNFEEEEEEEDNFFTTPISGNYSDFIDIIFCYLYRRIKRVL